MSGDAKLVAKQVPSQDPLSPDHQVSGAATPTNQVYSESQMLRNHTKEKVWVEKVYASGVCVMEAMPLPW